MSGSTAVLLLGFAKWLNADVRTAEYFLQLACFLLGYSLFGVCIGCGFALLMRVWYWNEETRRVGGYLSVCQGQRTSQSPTSSRKALMTQAASPGEPPFWRRP